MGMRYFYLFTVYKEPEHKELLHRATKKACMEYFKMGENWDYWSWKVEAGRVPEYSLIREKNTDVPPEDVPLKGSGLEGTTWIRKTGPDGETYNQVDGLRLLCGACPEWKADSYRSKDGRKHGLCGRDNEETERCTWCRFQTDEEMERKKDEMTQNEKILDWLKMHRTLTQAEAVRLFGCYRLSARIYEIREQGFDIRKTTQEAINRDGEKVHFAEYWLAQ